MAGKSKIVTGALEGLADVTEKAKDTIKSVTDRANELADDMGYNEAERKELIEEDLKTYARWEAEGDWDEIKKRAEASGNERFIMQAEENADDSPDPKNVKLGGEYLWDLYEVPNDFGQGPLRQENSSWYRIAIGTLEGLIDEFGDYEAFKRTLD